MLALTTGAPVGRYTLAQLTDALQGGYLALSPRFEVLDANLARLGDLSNVTKGIVTMNVDRAIKGSLDIEMLPDVLLPFATSPFTRYVKPYFRALMPDAGFVEWPQGVYLWNRPKRAPKGTGVEPWTLTLGDRGHMLLAGGPGPNGYSVASGVKQTDAIKQTLQTVFGSGIDISRITPSLSTVAGPLTWDMTQDTAIAAATSPSGGAKATASGTTGTNGTTWADILQALHASLGYYSVWFDGVGRPVSIPTPNLATAAAGVTYSSGAKSLLLMPVVVDEVLDALANRVIVRAKNAAAGSVYDIATADLNTLIPGHPYSQAVIKFYIDAIVDDTVAGTLADLQARANAELFTRAAMYQSVDIKTQAWPVHEAFDVVGVQWTGDSDFNTAKNLHERTWALDLFTGATTRTLRRIVP